MGTIDSFKYKPIIYYIYILVGINVIGLKENTIIISRCIVKEYISYTIKESVLNLKV